jgi:glycosyltransferase involved in cell wall biosynthesis
MLAVVETHPIQYHAPVYRALEARHGVTVTAIYGSDFSVRGYRDAEFGARFAWDTDLLAGYSATFLSTADAGAIDVAHVSPVGLRRALQACRPDAVLIGGYGLAFHRAAWFEAWRGGWPILFRGEATDQAADRGWLKAGVRSTALRVAYRTCARVLYIGEQARTHYRRLGVPDEKLVFSPYCVDTTPFDLSDSGRTRLRAATRQEWGIGGDRLVILYSGKLSDRKGVDLLVEAARRLPEPIGAKVTVVLVGDGARRETLAAAAARQPAIDLRCVGFHNQSLLSRCYHAADLLALPSRTAETWGLVVNEALHHGVPCVVSSRVGCAPDLVRPGVTGEVVEADSAAALAAGLERAAGLSGREDVREACRATVARYTVEAAAAGIAEAVRAVTSRRSGLERRAG